MQSMTARERVGNLLQRKPVDRSAFHEAIWGETSKRWWKKKSGTPEHVDFLVKDRAGWEQHIKPLLKPDRRRVDFKGYREAKKAAAERQEFFCWAGINVFEQMHPMCGHEYMLIGMALDPDWVRDMTKIYADLTPRPRSGIGAVLNFS